MSDVNFHDHCADHRGQCRPRRTYRRLLQQHLDDARAPIRALEAAGWRDIVVDPIIDCEAPTAPDWLEVTAQAPARPLGLTGAGADGYAPLRARLITARAATRHDLYVLIGGAATYGQVNAALIADAREPGLALPRQFNDDETPARVLICTPAEAGLPTS